MTFPIRFPFTLLCTLVLAVLAFPAQAEDWKSRAASQALVTQLDAQKVEAVAARDPEAGERFIAALRLPGQLLVVSASHPSADLVAARLERGEHREVYMDLQATPSQDTKFFVHDLDADGIELAERGEAADTIYDRGESLACDGRWKDAKLKEAEYRERVAEADERYARMLHVLADSLAAPGTAQ